MSRSSLTAVLGPTNTGKTHLAIERLCAHSSGMMGFPLRLLAREVYDRVRRIKGDASVALITGEEKILPRDARWLICTTESMPMERDVAFVALDEAQLGADPERGHVFTDRLLNARGREETMILGAATIAPLVRALVPEAEIIDRPRFSNLSYAGAKKLSRLPPRSAIVAFSAEEVYAIAEAIRRTRGGSAVVMGALSPRTRNAQVAMFESGEVDYLVATDAIGMGLNLDLKHVAFASLSKFDGRRLRRLFPWEMAQIAGRAGRHQRDGTFGLLAGNRPIEFEDFEIDRIENHRFTPLDHLYWRNAEPDFGSMDDLVESLEAAPFHANLRPAPEAIDLAVLKRLRDDEATVTPPQSPTTLARLWDMCGLPDFRQMGAEFHARLVAQLWNARAAAGGFIPEEIIGTELVRLDSIQGDIGTLTGRIAGARTWAYVSQRADWLANPSHWAERTQALEEKLSDALHEKLTERFVDRRTSLLVKGLARNADVSAVRFHEDGRITVEDEPLGSIEGFRVKIDPHARHGDSKRLTAAIDHALPTELAARANALLASPERDFAILAAPGQETVIQWRSHTVATIVRGRSLLKPGIKIEHNLSRLPPSLRDAISARLAAGLEGHIANKLKFLKIIEQIAEAPSQSPAIRALCASVVSSAGSIPRGAVEEPLSQLQAFERKRLTGLGLVVGTLDVFHPLLLKPEATRLRLALLSTLRKRAMPHLPMPGLGLLDRPSEALAGAASDAGYRRFGEQMLRIDLVERIARALHEQRIGKDGFLPDKVMATSLGIGQATFDRILRELGFRPVSTDVGHWRWQGRRRTARVAPQGKGSFEALRGLNLGRKS